jgi:uncharacterized membrane protein
MCIAPLGAYEGLSVATSYPSVTTGETELIIFDLTVKNYDQPPQRIDLEVQQLPHGWEYEFVGGGGLVDAVFVEPESTTSVQLWIAVNDQDAVGRYDFSVKATGSEHDFILPLTVYLEQDLPQRLALDPELPAVKGTVDSDFTFNVKVNNHSAREVLVDLDAEVPQGFSVQFAQQYGGKQLSTLSLESGSSETVKVTVKPRKDISEGSYPIMVVATSEAARATTQLTMEIEGSPELEIRGVNGLLSGSAVAGREQTFALEVVNSGSADLTDISFSSYKPSQWQVEFTPDKLDTLAAGETREIQAVVQPSSQAITGDYNVTFRANASEDSASERFRITVKTASMWSVVSLLIIAAAAVVLVFAIKKFGRR